jgi:hypothetical protein
MANFQLEGHGNMTGIVTVIWRVDPVTPPRPKRNCSTCGRARLFQSSGKIRLNANGRRLDAWLIYKCEACDRTWNLPVLARVPVGSIAPGDLQAMHSSDPEWVGKLEMDVGLLKGHCDQIDVSADLRVTKPVGDRQEPWSVIELCIVAEGATGHRLDRLLAGELKLSRSELQMMQKAGGLQFGEGSRKTLGRRVVVQFISDRLTESQRRAVSVNVVDR